MKRILLNLVLSAWVFGIISLGAESMSVAKAVPNWCETESGSLCICEINQLCVVELGTCSCNDPGE